MSNAPNIDGPVEVEACDEGGLWRVTLAAPKGNIIDAAMTRAVRQVYEAARETPELRGICLHGEGKHFSFGASVEEHKADQVADMLATFHGLFRVMLDVSVFTVAAVGGQCLGGGLELASFCNRVIAHSGAKLGQPEIKLGVIAPVASTFLPERIGRGAAEDLCISGRTIDAQEGLRIGLVEAISDEPVEAAMAYLREHILPHSGSSLRHAVRAVRLGLRERFLIDVDRAEKLYLDQLQATEDAVEGISAFVDRRTPTWKHR